MAIWPSILRGWALVRDRDSGLAQSMESNFFSWPEAPGTLNNLFTLNLSETAQGSQGSSSYWSPLQGQDLFCVWAGLSGSGGDSSLCSGFGATRHSFYQLKCAIWAWGFGILPRATRLRAALAKAPGLTALICGQGLDQSKNEEP